MNSQLFRSIKFLPTTLIIIVLAIYSLSMAVPVSAQVKTTVELQFQIQELLKVLITLQTQLAQLQDSSGRQADDEFLHLVGSKMVTTEVVRVRNLPSLDATQVGIQSPHTYGTVLDGPVDAGGHSWWKLRYDSGVVGWSAGQWLLFIEDTVPKPKPFLPISENPFSCKLRTDKSSYQYGETITLNWDSEGAVYARFLPDTSGKDNIKVPTGKFSTSGNVKLSASVTGNPYITLEIIDADGRSATCKRVVPVEVQSSSVKLIINGNDTTQWEALATETIEALYWPEGDIKSCKIIGHYDYGKISTDHDWDTTIKQFAPDSYGRVYFDAVTVYKDMARGPLEMIEVVCDVQGGNSVGDSATITVEYPSGTNSYRVTFNGREVVSGNTSTTYLDAYEQCLYEVDKINGVDDDVLKCYWGSKLIKEITQWKG